MDAGAWWAAVHGVGKSQIQLSDFTFTFHFPALEKEMATYFSTLAWKIPRMEETGRLQVGIAKSRARLSNFTSHPSHYNEHPAFRISFTPHVVLQGKYLITVHRSGMRIQCPERGSDFPKVIQLWRCIEPSLVLPDSKA